MNSKINSKRVVLNVGGVKHEVLWKTLETLPQTRLFKLKNAKSTEDILQLCDDYNYKNNEYFFDRHSRSFLTVLNFYRTKKLHIMDDICVISFEDELKYWGIQEFNLEACCQQKYFQKKEEIIEETRKEQEAVKKTQSEFNGCLPSARKKLWDLMENPRSSNTARVSLKICLI